MIPCLGPSSRNLGPTFLTALVEHIDFQSNILAPALFRIRHLGTDRQDTLTVANEKFEGAKSKQGSCLAKRGIGCLPIPMGEG